MSELHAEGLSIAVAGARLVEGASFRLRPGELVALIGPNGAGKTTLLRLALGLLRPSAGRALLDAEPAERLSPAVRARKVAYLPQVRPLAWPLKVRDIVALGRFAYGAGPDHLSTDDRLAVETAIEGCGLERFADRASDTLSGGEMARVHLARAIASRAPLLIADEPTAALDPLHAYAVMSLLRSFVDKGGGALIVVHDLALAARFADRFLWMKGGRILADGPPQETLTPERMRTIYGVRARILEGAAPAIIIDGPDVIP